MRIFKATYKDRTGKRRESKKWYCEIRDHLERRRRLPAYESKKASEEFGRKLEALVACRLCGDRPDGDLRKWLEALPARMTAKLMRWGILDTHRAAAATPLREHAEDYRLALSAKGNGAEHVATTLQMVMRILAGCRFEAWSDVSASRVQRFLADLRSEGAGISTSNSYLSAFKAFCIWCVQDGRISESPVDHLRRLNARTDVRRKRRALSADELRRIIEAAQGGPEWRDMPGHERALLYRLAAESGLRWSELRSLRLTSFDLAGDPPTVTVQAGYSKRRRDDVLPLRRDTANVLQACFDRLLRLPNALAFPHMPKGRVGARMLRFDEAAAGVEYMDASGRQADFHALRHSFTSALARGGVHPKTAQDLARHSDINLTMSTYTHTFLKDRKDALDALPDLDQPSEAKAAEMARTAGTDDRILLGHVLGQKDAIQADSSRPIQTTEQSESPRKCGKSWSGRLDSNQRPLEPHSSALPSCATPRRFMNQPPVAAASALPSCAPPRRDRSSMISAWSGEVNTSVTPERRRHYCGEILIVVPTRVVDSLRQLRSLQGWYRASKVTGAFPVGASAATRSDARTVTLPS